MKNSQLLPFERNRYYAGKLLTSADLLAEQTYLNNKRWFANSLMFGSGIVCGLSVYNLDDLSVMIESGVAIDGQGREIVLENSAVKKLSAMEGFETLETDEISLCLRYEEEETQKIYSIGAAGAGDGEYEANRIRENAVFFLVDKNKNAQEEEFVSEFLNTACLYSDEDYTVDISMPATVPCGLRSRLDVKITKISDTAKDFSMNCVLQTPAFTNSFGEHELSIKADGVLPEEINQSEILSYWLTAQEQEINDTMIIVKSNFAKITIDGEDKRLSDNFILKSSLSQASGAAITEREIARVSLEMRNMLSTNDYIWLADLTIQRTKSSYLIEKIDEHSAKRYIHTAAAEHLRQGYSEWFSCDEKSTSSTSGMNYPSALAQPTSEPIYATGVCEIPLEVDSRKGTIVYSDEIMHGLGKGNVHVSVGFEYLAEDKKLQQTAKSTIYGDASLFAQNGNNGKDRQELPIAHAATAVKVMNDRGSFTVAAKLTKDTHYVVIVLRWVAVKLPSGEEQTMLKHMTDKSIAATQPTVVLETRESHFFNVQFKNMEPVTLNYALTENDSGSITSDGIYTAPNKEGVYEILISCSDMPMIRTYAYAVVKKKGLED